jgi:hypothetical protein
MLLIKPVRTHKQPALTLLKTRRSLCGCADAAGEQMLRLLAYCAVSASLRTHTKHQEAAASAGGSRSLCGCAKAAYCAVSASLRTVPTRTTSSYSLERQSVMIRTHEETCVSLPQRTRVSAAASLSYCLFKVKEAVAAAAHTHSAHA